MCNFVTASWCFFPWRHRHTDTKNWFHYDLLIWTDIPQRVGYLKKIVHNLPKSIYEHLYIFNYIYRLKMVHFPLIIFLCLNNACTQTWQNEFHWICERELQWLMSDCDTDRGKRGRKLWFPCFSQSSFYRCKQKHKPGRTFNKHHYWVVTINIFLCLCILITFF